MTTFDLEAMAETLSTTLLSRARLWLADQGITITDEALERAGRKLRDWMTPAGRTNAARLVVNDTRAEPEPNDPTL